jgi:hypothetical protein
MSWNKLVQVQKRFAAHSNFEHGVEHLGDLQGFAPSQILAEAVLPQSDVELGTEATEALKKIHSHGLAGTVDQTRLVHGPSLIISFLVLTSRHLTSQEPRCANTRLETRLYVE